MKNPLDMAVEEFGGCILKIVCTLVALIIIIVSDLLHPIIIGIVTTCILVFLINRIRKRGNGTIRRKRLNIFLPKHILAFIMLTAGALGLLLSLETPPPAGEWYNEELRKLIIESNLMKIFAAGAFICGALYFVIKAIICRCYGSEILALIKSEELINEAKIMRQFLIHKMGDDGEENISRHISVERFLRLTHSLGYRVTIRKVSDENIEQPNIK